MSEKKKCIIVKIGSNTITGGEDGLDEDLLKDVARQASELVGDGWRVVVVSSGAVALGKPRMRSCDLSDILCKQRAAARGQPLLMAGWQRSFNPYGLEVDQLLFNKQNFAAHMKVLRAIDDGVVVANGDDTGNEPGVERTVIYEDNDDLAADIAIEMKADVLLYLSDSGGILDRTGRVVRVVGVDVDLAVLGVLDGGKSGNGTGGIKSKHKYASMARKNGVRAIIAGGGDRDVILKVARGEEVGTRYEMNSEL